MKNVALYGSILSRWAASVPRVRRVWVFGSVAKGSESPRDLDVAVEIDGEEPLLFWMEHGSKWESELQALLPIKVDLQWFDPDGGTPVISNGLTEAKVLVYERAG